MRAKNITKYIKGISGITKSVLGIDRTHEKIIRFRINTCKSCDKNVYTKSGSWKCAECGCYLTFKISVSSENCPLNKW